MNSDTGSNRGSFVAHSARAILTFVIVALLVAAGLLLLERSGPSPVRPFGQNISSSRPDTSGKLLDTTVTRNPNRHCHHHDDDDNTNSSHNKNNNDDDDDCRPPSGD